MLFWWLGRLWYRCDIRPEIGPNNLKKYLEYVIDGSTRKPALGQDTDYMVEKTYNLEPYFDPFEAYFRLQLPI